MTKIKLNLSELKVDSFETAKTKSEQGTVKGFRPVESEPVTCPDTCMNTCAFTCDPTCNPDIGTCCIHC